MFNQHHFALAGHGTVPGHERFTDHSHAVGHADFADHADFASHAGADAADKASRRERLEAMFGGRYFARRAGDDAEGGRRGGRGPRGPRGGGPRGGMHSGLHGGHGRRGFGSRARRGDVRAGILALLAEQPRHGYELMQELSERTGGVWKPSPGSVYPALSLLEDEGLIRAEESGGKRVFHLTDAGRAEVDSREGPPPWEQVTDDDNQGNLYREFALVAAAVKQFRHVGSASQHAAAQKILADTRRGLYKILAEDLPADED